MSFGKRIELSVNGIEPKGVCTWMCPYTCKILSVSPCKCKNSDAKNKGASYDTNFNKVVHSQRTPDGM
jgi:hypothetical protein